MSNGGDEGTDLECLTSVSGSNLVMLFGGGASSLREAETASFAILRYTDQ